MKSIRRQLTRNLLGATLVLLGGGLLAMYLAARDAVLDQFDAALRAKALAISTLTRVTGDGVSIEFSDRFLRGFDDEKPRDFFQLWDAAGSTLQRSESLKKARDLPLRFRASESMARWNFTLPNGRPGRAVGFSFRPRTTGPSRRESETEVRLVVASDREDLDETQWQLLGLAAGCAALLIGATVWLIPHVLRRGLQPLGELGERAARIDADSLAVRFPVNELPAELRPIAQRLNDLLARLETSFERERRFSADLAHELRTPLAELRSAAECALKWPDTRDPATDRETLAIAQQMETLVTQMLALTRGEQGQLVAKLERLPLDQLVRDVWRGFATPAAERGLRVEFALHPITVNADAVLLRSIVTNLIANAVDYTPGGGGIELTIEDSGERVSLHVTNSTNDLSPDDLPRLFDRFWRKESSRSSGQHVGLGLSLARSFAAAMNWTLTAQFDSQQRLRFTLAGSAIREPVISA
jgi:two-component system sensor histidine kinase QseC